jgi:hypothetical protein
MRPSTMAGILGLSLVAGCAGGMGGGGPLQYRAMALNVPAGVAADSVAAIVRNATADLVLLVAPADSAWFARAAGGTTLHLSGPTGPGPERLAFLAMKPVGDTTLTLKLPGASGILLHDGLYQPEKSLYVDLMLARVTSAAPADSVAHALVSYVASDVMQNAALVLGLLTPTPELGDTVARLIRPIMVDVGQCGAGRDTAGDPAAAAGPIRLFYGPETLVRCDQTRSLVAAGQPVYAHFTIGAKQP